MEAVAREIAPLLQPDAVVVNKSTVPVGTTRLVARWLAESGATHDARVASNPEFLREGTAVRDFLQPQRIVIGCDDATVAVRVSELYRGVPRRPSSPTPRRPR
jgi:UDPglucose 6-dehydrogenase